MKVLTIDIETASVENIKECGVYRYAESEFFDLLLVSYSIDGGAVATCDIANGDTLPDEILCALTDKSIIKKAFNVNFERVCLSVFLRKNYPELLDFEDAVGNYIDPESWQCDMIHSRYLGMMSSLDDIRFIKDMFTSYITEECNEDVLTFLNDTVERIEVGNTIDVKLKKNIKIDRDTKKIFVD